MTPLSTADETRARILMQAKLLFRRHGHSKTTVADIAKACAMSSANVYRFFPSKSAIEEAICGVIISELGSRLREIGVADAPASKRLIEFVELVARYTAETYTKEKRVHDMVVVAMEEKWGTIDQHLHAAEAIIAKIIESGVNAGEFKPQDPAKAARCVRLALAGFSHPVLVAQRYGDPHAPTPIEMAVFILSALKA